jgi:N-acetylmuramoyl-L-alanine amidase
VILMQRIATVGLLAATLFVPATLGPAWGQAAGGAPKQASAPACDRAEFQVIVDVGHTAESPGAVSSRGFREYDFNLRLAKEIEQKLIEAGFAKTMLLVTEGKGLKGLFKRVLVANGSHADLFLSIHHDSVPNYFLEKWEYEGQELTFSDRFKGHSIFISNNNSDVKSSLAFGSLLGKQLKARGLQYTPHYTESFMKSRRRQLVDAIAGVYRYDQLIVLRATRMPAVLLEAGSIINRDEEALLGTPGHRALIAAAVSDAVEAYCAARRPLNPHLIARSQRSNPTKNIFRPAAAAQPAKPGAKQ